MTEPQVTLVSLSAAMDGGFTAIVDVSNAVQAVGSKSDYRLIGGVNVMLHLQRLGLNLPWRATGDADFGVPPHLLREPELVEAIESLGYRKVLGNRWERQVDIRRVASVDLLIPAYKSRARSTVKVGNVVTTEVPGLAEALRRPGVEVNALFRLTTGEALTATVVLPDVLSTLALKTLVRGVRNEERDAQDLWRCLEIAAAVGVTPADFEQSSTMVAVRRMLTLELAPSGAATNVLIRGLQDQAAARMRTRLRALLAEVVEGF
jgi:hypothetical protein